MKHHSFKEKAERIKTSIDGETYHGVLIYGEGKQISVKLDNEQTSFSQKRIDLIKIESQNDTSYLNNSEFYGDTIYSDYISSSPLLSDKPNKIIICIDGLSTLLHELHTNEITDTHVVINRNKSLLNNIQTDTYHIRDYWKTEISSLYEEAIHYNVFDSHHIEITKKSGYFAFKEIKNLSFDLLTLLTTMTLLPLNISNISYLNPSNRKIESIYFPLLHSHKNKPRHRYQSLINLKIIPRQEWEELLQYALEESAHSKVWGRIRGAILDQGYWETNLLTVVSILDSHLSSKVKVKTKKPAILKEIAHQLINIRDHLPHSMLSQFDELDIGKISIQYDIKSTFQVKFDTVYNELSDDFKKWIGINESNFQKIKKIRDAVAHCDTTKINKENNIGVLFSIRDKLFVLLAFLFMKEVGITEHLFLQLVSNNHNPIARNALLSNFYLQRIIQPNNIVYIKHEDFEKASELSKDTISIIYITEDNVTLDQDALLYLKERLKSNEGKEFIAIVEEYYKQKDIYFSSIEYKGCIYLSCEEKHLQLYCAMIVHT